MRHPSTLSVQLTPTLTSHSHFLIKVNSSIQTTQSLTISTIFKDQCISTTNCFMISSVILLAQVPSVSPLLPFITNYLIIGFNITIIMHQAMLLTAQVHLFSFVSTHGPGLRQMGSATTISD